MENTVPTPGILIRKYEVPTWYTMDVVRDAMTHLSATARITSVLQLNPTTWRIDFTDDTGPNKVVHKEREA